MKRKLIESFKCTMRALMFVGGFIVAGYIDYVLLDREMWLLSGVALVVEVTLFGTLFMEEE